MHRVIGERDLSEAAVDEETARAVLRDMVRARHFDERALSLQRRGWMPGYPPFKGQEGSQVGAAHAMADDDWLFPTYRSNAMQLARGVPASDILLFRRGHAEFHSDHDVPVFPQAIPIASQIPHAVGAGMAMDYADDPDAVIAYFGDGATSEGDFHEAMNFAGVFDAPVVFLCENNNWAISLPRERQTASDSIAVKAEAYGFEGVQVDGNDPLAVHETVSDALEDARGGDPVLVESLTYRQGAHTTSDDPDRYRPEDEDLPEWRTADPVDRFAEYLEEQGVIDEAFVEDCFDEAEAELDDAIAAAEEVGEPDVDELFDYAYAEHTPRIAEQKAWLDEWLEDHDPQEMEF
ncbi:pyruvate dehydrogenase (acetyl-transferring) E1 component subunit alpha [Halobacterium litoreum]|uniref:Pyruvate dehydrogenase (Acetyl-transferring) E1 component subunit alpha n=1 Tax=Halobacterium litoreum TaxID=2039234 RepID=A0ABD5NDS3_9EURY|nr:pyruvate dehydrogenase (acetyl-transferring) E1 component subunit alpha [Halobacterium litoreum]UHH13738.1 pyruvate dehydrogenase (acetyl-transferring) E1 component subunit alpha [Halobacterium litoreum]